MPQVNCFYRSVCACSSREPGNAGGLGRRFRLLSGIAWCGLQKRSLLAGPMEGVAPGLHFHVAPCRFGAERRICAKTAAAGTAHNAVFETQKLIGSAARLRPPWDSSRSLQAEFWQVLRAFGVPAPSSESSRVKIRTSPRTEFDSIQARRGAFVHRPSVRVRK